MASKANVLAPVVCELGAAVYLSQQFETSLLLLVSILSTEQEAVSTYSFNSAVGRHLKRKSTLGWLARELMTILALPDNFESFIEAGVETRNRIAHGFVMRNSEKFLTAQGRSELVAELREAQRILKDCLTLVNEALDGALKVFGGSLERLKNEVEARFEPGDFENIARY